MPEGSENRVKSVPEKPTFGRLFSLYPNKQL